jgi:ABC-type Co2+ transport system permease subunit
MGIINRRNAVLGWGVWKIAKRIGKRKARAAVPGTGRHAGLNKSAIASIFAAIGGALWFWRKKSDESASGSE